MKLCHTCSRGNIFYSDKGSPECAHWIKKAGLVPVPVMSDPSETEESYPKKSDIEITLLQSKLEPGTKIFFWAAQPKKLEEANKIVSAKMAYGRKKGKGHNNSGCTRVGTHGEIRFRIESPQCYKEGDTIWAKHLHFVKEVDGEWDADHFYTVNGAPVHGPVVTEKLRSGGVFVTPTVVRKLWKEGKFWMVYALPEKFPSLHDIGKYKDFNHIRLDYSKGKITVPKVIKKGTPLVIYCSQESSNSGKILLGKLASLGYENLFLMDAGMLGFSRESMKLFSEVTERRSRDSVIRMSNLI